MLEVHPNFLCKELKNELKVFLQEDLLPNVFHADVDHNVDKSHSEALENLAETWKNLKDHSRLCDPDEICHQALMD